MNITILGAGNIGGTLGAKWANAGHAVTFGVRDVDSPKTQAVLKAGSHVVVDTIANALARGDVIVVAIPGAAVRATAEAYAAALNGKVVIDASNNVGAPDMSAVGVLTAHASQARIFRAFNTLGWENFAEPQIAGVQADLFYCGPTEPASRAIVEQLIAEVGLRPVYVGGLDQVGVVDNLTRLWFALAVGKQKGRHLAFKLLAHA